MARKQLPNRISKKIGADQIARARMLLQEVANILGEDTQISDEDYKALLKISDKRKLDADDTFQIAQAFPEFMEESIPLSEVAKDKSYYEDTDTLRTMHKTLSDKLEKEQNVAGAEYFNAMLIYEENVRLKAARDNSRAQLALKQLNDLKRRRGGGANAKKNASKP
jgi:hypothetical protein